MKQDMKKLSKELKKKRLHHEESQIKNDYSEWLKFRKEALLTIFTVPKSNILLLLHLNHLCYNLRLHAWNSLGVRTG